MNRFHTSQRFLRRLRFVPLLVGLLTSVVGAEISYGNPFYDAAPSPIVVESATSQRQPSTFKRGKIVPFQANYSVGSIIVSTDKNELFLVIGPGKAVQYPVATAKSGFEWTGKHRITAKVKWPDWRPPPEMRERKPELPEYMEGGPQNPLGARALYLGSSIYRIHGTNEPKSIGKRASSGCIRMLNEDVTELFQHVKMGALVVVI